MTSLLPEPADPAALTASDLEARRRHAYRLAAMETVSSARCLLGRKLEALARDDLHLPSADLHAALLDELAEGYFSGRMGDREQLRLAGRRLAEATLRQSVPRYSARRDPDAVGYYNRVYRDLFDAFGLTRSSLTLVDGNLFAALQRRHLFPQL